MISTIGAVLLTYPIPAPQAVVRPATLSVLSVFSNGFKPELPELKPSMTQFVATEKGCCAAK